MSEKVKSYRELLIWQKGIELVKDVYKVTTLFPKEETYTLCNQLRRSAVSIPSNIAEGQARQHTGEFRQFLFVALGSLAELDTQLVISNEHGYLSSKELDKLNSQIKELQKIIRGLISKLTTDHSPLTTNRGFSLVELLMAIFMATIVAMAGYTVFLTGDRLYNINEDVSEAQQNVRVAMDRLAKDIRVTGFGLPEQSFSLTFSNLSTTSPTLPNPITTPITVTNSFTGNDTITVLGIGYEVGTLMKGGATDCNDRGKGKICLDSVASVNNFFTGSGPYTYQPNRRYISLNGIKFIELANTQTETDRSAGKLTLSSPATLDRDYPDGTPVYIIQAVQYTIATDLTGCSSKNPCLVSRDYTMLRGGSTPGAREVLAENIEDIQFAYGIDSDGDGDVDSYSDNPSNPSQIVAVRVNVVGRTRGEDPSGIKNFKMPCLEDRGNDPNCVNAAKDGYRRIVLTRIVKLRN